MDMWFDAGVSMLRAEGGWVKFFTRPEAVEERREDDGERKERFRGLGYGEEVDIDERAEASGKAEAGMATFVVFVTDLRKAILFVGFWFSDIGDDCCLSVSRFFL